MLKKIEKQRCTEVLESNFFLRRLPSSEDMPLYCLLQTQVTSSWDCCNECVLFSLATYPTIRFCPPRVQFRIVSHCRLQSPSETQGMTSPSSRGSVGVSRGHSGSTGVTPEAQQESMLQRPCKGHSRGSTGVSSEAQQESMLQRPCKGR